MGTLLQIGFRGLLRNSLSQVSRFAAKGRSVRAASVVHGAFQSQTSSGSPICSNDSVRPAPRARRRQRLEAKDARSLHSTWLAGARPTSQLKGASLSLGGDTRACGTVDLQK